MGDGVEDKPAEGDTLCCVDSDMEVHNAKDKSHYVDDDDED